MRRKFSKYIIWILIIIIIILLFGFQEVSYKDKCQDMGYKTQLDGKTVEWNCDQILANTAAGEFPENWADKCCMVQECRIYPACFAK